MPNPIRTLDELRTRAAARQGLQKSLGARLMVCAGTGCLASGAAEVYEELVRLLETGMAPGVTAGYSGCHGFCGQGPLVRVEPQGYFYVNVKPKDAKDIIAAAAANQTVDRLLFRDGNGELYRTEEQVPFYSGQVRVALSGCGHLDPEDLEDALAHGGYQALAYCLTQMTPENVIAEVKTSGLRGRGGGGFPTGTKWLFARQSPGTTKYLICNGDEGDPGAFMDRSVMEGDPHRVLEGMAIAAYAIGAQQGYIYVRAEYPLAVSRLHKAVAAAREHGLLGKDLFGSGFDFDIHVVEGAGAFVCGEETALIASIEGRRGMPTPRPPYPSTSGLWGSPTVINNVETLANIPPIISRGGAWFRSMGTEGSPGTKTFALTGQVVNTGLVEVPMGTTLRRIVDEIGGGVRGGRTIKAVQIGGPSGGCLPAALLDLPLDYETLVANGAMVGSGGLVVIDDSACMVGMAKFFMEFTYEESCGKCTPCRDGTARLLEMLTAITEGRGRPEDLDRLERLARAVKDASLCGLGQTAPNPVLSTLRYFREEYQAHLDGHCPAGVCVHLSDLFILEDKCKGCGACKKVCPSGAISGELKELHIINTALCIKCDACIPTCAFEAITRR